MHATSRDRCDSGEVFPQFIVDRLAGRDKVRTKEDGAMIRLKVGRKYRMSGGVTGTAVARVKDVRSCRARRFPLAFRILAHDKLYGGQIEHFFSPGGQYIGCAPSSVGDAVEELAATAATRAL
jgi:hypothetical protein